MNENRKDRNEYDDFFDRTLEDSKSEQKPTHYYSYGPFTPTSSQPRKEIFIEDDHHEDKVEQFGTSETFKDTTTSEHKPKRRAGWFPMLLAGALIAALLMFVADYTNLFTGDQAAPPAVNDDQGAEQTGGSASPPPQADSASFVIAHPDNIADIVSMAGPAVVKIETYVEQGRGQRRMTHEDFFRYFFGDEYFRQPEQPDSEGGKRVQSGLGSGFIFDEQGYILTNEHVIRGADTIQVQLLNRPEPYEAELLGSDFELDLAVLKITDEDRTFPTLKMGDSSALRIGEWVTAIGNPVGFDHTVSVGVISANEREISIPDSDGTRSYQHLLQTDASINPGNSGGPLLNMNGEVIGINTAVSAQAQGIGFAIPTSTILEVLDQLKNNEPIPKPFIGVGLSDIDEQWKEELKLESTKGTIVLQVQRPSPAQRAGLQPGDVIIELEGEEVADSTSFSDRIKQFDIGTRVMLTVVRDGTTLELAVLIGDRNEP